MSGHLVRAEGAPCPTLVLDWSDRPAEGPGLLGSLTDLRSGLTAAGHGDVLKNALVRRSAHPLFDLDYHFVQSLPEAPDAYDLRGSCGHSILSAVDAAARCGLVQPLRKGARIRVNVLNNGDNVVCEVEDTWDGGSRFTAHFLCTPPAPLDGLLLTDGPVSQVETEDVRVSVSLVSMGNPYIFADATALGVGTVDELFADDPALLARFRAVRHAVCAAQGWGTGGAFPKIAAVLPTAEGELAVRAVSVPSWHPTLALTGAVCLAAATGIEGTVPYRLARRSPTEPLRLWTPGGLLSVDSRTQPGPDGEPRMAWVSVAGKEVTYQGSAPLPMPDRTAQPVPAFPRKEELCLSSTV